MSDAPVRVGFVGCGRQASASWYPNFATIPELVVCEAICDSIERKAPVNVELS